MTSSDNPLPRARERSRLAPQIITTLAAAPLLLCAFLPLAKGTSFAAAADDRLRAATPETRALAKGVLRPGPKAEIAPPEQVVMQGQQASFSSRSTAGPDAPIENLQWTGPANQNSQRGVFVVETARLRPGTYAIRLTVVDKYKRQDQQFAKLIVSQGTSDRGSRDDVGGVEFRAPLAKINPETKTVRQGQPARFVSASRHPDPTGRIIRYAWTTQWGQTGEASTLDIDTTQLRAGTYWVRLAVSDQRRRADSDTARLVVAQKPPDAGNGTSDGGGGIEGRGPVARINPHDKTVTQGDTARFASNSRHRDPRGRIIRQNWTTQWGQTAVGDSLVVDTRGLRPGRYRVTLEVADQRELRDADTATLLVINRPQPPDNPNPTPPPNPPPNVPLSPIAKINPPIREVDQGASVFFDGRESRDPDGKIVSWSWQVDGKPVSSQSFVDLNGDRFSPGRHTISLKVTDNQGLTGVDNATLVIKQLRNLDVALIKFDVAPPEPAPNQEVRLTATVANQGTDTVRNINVRFEGGGTLIAEKPITSLLPGAQSDVTAAWVGRSPGKHTLVATVDPHNQLADANKTNNSKTRGMLVQSPPVVTIDPNPQEVLQGEKATFVSRVTFPAAASDGGLKYLWRGPGGRVGHGSSFEFDTGAIQPGKHDVNVEVSRNQGPITKASALLVITARPEVWLVAETQDPETGQTIKFSGGTKPSLSGTEYKFLFGDNKETDWSSTPEAIHSYELSRNYTVQLIARRAGMTIGQTSTGIAVKEIPYSVTLTSDPENARAGAAVTFTARVEPAANDVEYRFRFSDGHETVWTPLASTTHSFPKGGTYTATAAIRIRTRIVESPAKTITVSAPVNFLWPLLAVLAVGILAAAAAYRAKAKLWPAKVYVVPRVDLDSLTVATSGNLEPSCEISVRAGRGDYESTVVSDEALVRS